MSADRQMVVLSLTYSHNGCRTNCLSIIRLCGTERLSLSKVSSLYRSRSKSIIRGPFSTVFVLPSSVSISLTSLSSSSGVYGVSTYAQDIQPHQLHRLTRAVKYLANTIDEKLLIFEIHWLCLVKRTSPYDINISLGQFITS